MTTHDELLSINSALARIVERLDRLAMYGELVGADRKHIADATNHVELAGRSVCRTTKPTRAAA